QASDEKLSTAQETFAVQEEKISMLIKENSEALGYVRVLQGEISQATGQLKDKVELIKQLTTANRRLKENQADLTSELGQAKQTVVNTMARQDVLDTHAAQLSAQLATTFDRLAEAVTSINERNATIR